jgi:hypothetical protein
MSQPAELNAPLGQAEEASWQVECAARFVCARHAVSRLSVIAHSGGTIATALFAIRNPELVDRLVFFAPIARREPKDAPRHRYPARRLISLQDQWQRFTEKVPEGQPPVLAEEHFRDWSQRYLKTDPDSGLRSPPSVKTPTGIIQEIAAAWARQLGYDPTRIHAPVAIIRGEWDRMCTDADAGWLFDALSGSPVKRDVKISRATHLMHRQGDRHADGDDFAERRPPGRRVREGPLEGGGNRCRRSGPVLISSAAAPRYHGSLSGNAGVEQSDTGHHGERSAIGDVRSGSEVSGPGAPVLAPGRCRDSWLTRACSSGERFMRDRASGSSIDTCNPGWALRAPMAP